ncbi:hypothetical protein [Mesomycoplasma ovipneumoniae]|uniref:thermonuclease family protein n=1 Tax=Mesomycoplasma ovipneumoniae TaxID=29562 RepID=UPI00311CCAEE
MKRKFLKLFFTSINFTFIPFFIAACTTNQGTQGYFQAQKYYKIEDFSQNPELDLKNQDSQYAKDIAKFLNPNYSWTEEDKLKFKDDTLPDSKFFNLQKVQIQKWTDGDTATLKSVGEVLIEPVFNVRIESIDTPEVGTSQSGTYKKTEGLEAEYAGRATRFAEKMLPKGTEVYFVYPKTGPARSFNRYVGSLFFGHNGFYKSYGVEIIKAGLAVPTLQSGFSGITNQATIYYYNSIKQAAAVENSINKKFGIYEKLKDSNISSVNENLESIYKTRGLAKISDFLVLGEENKDNNVVDWYEFRLENSKDTKSGNNK